MLRGATRTSDWFAKPDPDTGEVGLRFDCSMCGNCCTGAPGYVLVSDAEVERMAQRLGCSDADFRERYTHQIREGCSLTEIKTEFGHDCVFLDRTTIPGKAICRVYEDRPDQCQTWPFWKSNLKNRRSWAIAGRSCPGIDHGALIPPEQIRISRDRTDS